MQPPNKPHPPKEVIRARMQAGHCRNMWYYGLYVRIDKQWRETVEHVCDACTKTPAKYRDTS